MDMVRGDRDSGDVWDWVRRECCTGFESGDAKPLTAKGAAKKTAKGPEKSFVGSLAYTANPR
jgi:hypothetical protein